MSVEQQYIDLFSQTEAMICRHSAEALNAPRAAAFADFERLGFPTRKTEKYKYTDVSKFFEPDYGLNLNRLEIPVNPYEVFKCDVPNMSTSLYFVVNDAFYNKALPKSHLPEGVIFGSLKEMAEQRPELVKKYYGKLADTSKDGVTAFNTAFAQDGVLLYVPKNVVVEKPIQLVNILRGDVNFMVNRRVLIKPTAIIIATAVMAAISLPRLPLMSIYGKLLNEPNRRNKMKLRASGEDYLEAVLMLQKKNGMVRSIDLARHMEVSKPSVSRAVAILQEGGFLTVDSDYFLHLTEAGREVAEKIYERHQFFAEQLVAAGVDQETAEQEACRMEHAISDTSFQKLKETVQGTD